MGGGQTSCPALELLPAGAGRRRVWTEFGADGQTDRRPAALDWKGELRASVGTPARLGGPAERGSPCGVGGSRTEFAPEGRKEAAPLGSPRRLAGGSDGPKLGGLGPNPLRGLERAVSSPLPVLAGGCWETRLPPESRS